MGSKNYGIVEVHRGGKTFRRRQPLHHRINRKVLRHELERLSEEKEVVEENMRKAKRRARMA